MCMAFYKHVEDHAVTYNYKLNGGRVFSDGFHCCWEGCKAKPTTTISHLIAHLHVHTGEKVIACPTCNAQFANQAKFSDHLIKQTEGKFMCSFCSTVKPTKRLLADHVRKHINTQKCPHCEMTCATKHALSRHILYKHTECVLLN